LSHFAKIENGRVVTVIVAEKDFIDTQEGTWVQTSYNTFGGQHSLGGTPMRKNYAGIGYHYDYVIDAFYAPQPWPSWSLNQDTCWWEPPTPYPDDDDDDDDDDGPYKKYLWDEDTTSWIERS
tara:strand:+ start:158 stop:523 length:366 start_codon:yes stop_codon:yes gene_type:complete